MDLYKTCPSCTWRMEIELVNGVCPQCGVNWHELQSRPTPDAQDGATGAATLSGLYNCQVCGQEKCVEPGICDDCLAPPTEFEINQWRDEESAPPVI